MISKAQTQNDSIVNKNYLAIDEGSRHIETTNSEVAKLKKQYGKKYKLIQLNGVVNKYVKVSNKDYIIFSKSNWFLNNNGNVVNEQHILMCDLIIKPTNGYAVKHRDGDKLNNLRNNLKIANYKKILLEDKITETLVDIEDYDWLSKYTWHVNDDGYVENSKKELMHNLVMMRIRL